MEIPGMSWMVYCLVFMSSKWTTVAVMLKQACLGGLALCCTYLSLVTKHMSQNIAMVMHSDCGDLAGQLGKSVERGP